MERREYMRKKKLREDRPESMRVGKDKHFLERRKTGLQKRRRQAECLSFCLITRN